MALPSRDQHHSNSGTRLSAFEFLQLDVCVRRRRDDTARHREHSMESLHNIRRVQCVLGAAGILRRSLFLEYLVAVLIASSCSFSQRLAVLNLKPLIIYLKKAVSRAVYGKAGGEL